MDKIIIGLLILIWATLVGVWYLDTQNKKKEQARQFVIQQMQEDKLQSCLNNAETTYELNWNEECAFRGEGDDCLLYKTIGLRLDEYRQQMRDDCFKQFGN